jgi:hypothetical protein
VVGPETGAGVGATTTVGSVGATVGTCVVDTVVGAPVVDVVGTGVGDVGGTVVGLSVVATGTGEAVPPTGVGLDVAGAAVGSAVGASVGAAMGFAVGTAVGVEVGVSVGPAGPTGAAVGMVVGTAVGLDVGAAVGPWVGTALGAIVGGLVGTTTLTEKLECTVASGVDPLSASARTDIVITPVVGKETVRFPSDDSGTSHTPTDTGESTDPWVKSDAVGSVWTCTLRVHAWPLLIDARTWRGVGDPGKRVPTGRTKRVGGSTTTTVVSHAMPWYPRSQKHVPRWQTPRAVQLDGHEVSLKATTVTAASRMVPSACLQGGYVRW